MLDEQILPLWIFFIIFVELLAWLLKMLDTWIFFIYEPVTPLVQHIYKIMVKGLYLQLLENKEKQWCASIPDKQCACTLFILKILMKEKNHYIISFT